MAKGGSARMRQRILALASPAVVLLGVAAMFSIHALAGRLGTRPTLLASELLLAAPGLMVMAILGLPVKEVLGLKWFDGRTALLSLLAGGALWVGSLGLLEVQYTFWSPPPGYLEAFRRLHEALRPADALDAALSVAAIALAPSICEEVLFRGTILPPLAATLGAPVAILVAAGLFGSIHLDFTPGLSLYRVPFAFFVGVALGALRLRSGSLWSPILAHAVLNTITFAAAPHANQEGLPEPRPLLGLLLLSAGGAGATLVLRRIRPEECEE